MFFKTKLITSLLERRCRRLITTTEKLSMETSAKQGQKKTKAQKKGKGAGGDAASGTKLKELNPWPSYLTTRLEFFKELKEESDALKKKKQETDAAPIKVSLPDGKVIDATSWVSTPYEVACGISKGLADNAIVAKVNGTLWDLDRPFESDATLELLTRFEDDEAKTVYWHSTAHILGEAMERAYDGQLCYGPPIEQGFYYDMYMGDRAVSDQNDFPAIEAIMKSAIKEKQPFERLTVTKENLLKLFAYNPFKLRILNEKVKTPTTTVYRCGPLIDLCRGPHVRHTGKIKAFKLYKNSATYWEGKADKESLQRIYGISFADKKQLKEWERIQEEAKQRDHRKIGREQELFFFNELSPGSCFFYPRGAFIYNTLMKFIKEEYHKRGFQEVITPNIYNSKLWKTSGHWDHYSENIFKFDVEKETFALKPMNCPGHCVMFANRSRSWRELPLRYADFGVLHRNELSGALTGLTRVRRFQQDDAHIFCRPEDIKSEMLGAMDFLSHVYDAFGFTFKLFLSTRPEKYLGDIDMWNAAEKQLEECLNESGHPWNLNPGDGAFYGPKIDIQIMDALQRPHQCATIQLDFQLPIRFNLQYVTGDGDEKKHPIMIHRAVLGSVERMIAILTENYGGKWPLWLSPRQVMVISVSQKFDAYANSVKERLHAAEVQVEFENDPGLTLNKKIRNAQLEQFNFIVVVGEKEATNGTVNIRTRNNKVHGERSVESFVERIKALTNERHKHAEDVFSEDIVVEELAEKVENVKID